LSIDCRYEDGSPWNRLAVAGNVHSHAIGGWRDPHYISRSRGGKRSDQGGRIEPQRKSSRTGTDFGGVENIQSSGSITDQNAILPKEGPHTPVPISASTSPVTETGPGIVATDHDGVGRIGDVEDHEPGLVPSHIEIVVHDLAGGRAGCGDPQARLG